MFYDVKCMVRLGVVIVLLTSKLTMSLKTDDESLQQLSLAKHIFLDDSMLDSLYKWNKSSEIENNVTVEVSCRQWKFLKTIFSTTKFCMPVTLMRKCHEGKFNLLEIYKSIFMATDNNLVESVINLINYWNYENVIFYIDSNAGFSSRDVTEYLKLSLRGIVVEVVFVDSIKNLREKMDETTKKFLNFVIICNSSNTNRLVKLVKENDLFKTILRWVIISNTLPNALQAVYISPDSQVTLISSFRSKEKSNFNNAWKSQQTCVNNPGNVVLRTEEVSSINLKQSSTIFMYDVFYSNLTLRVESVKFASWTVQKRLQILENLDSNDINNRLRGRHIRTAAFNHLPYVVPIKTNGTAAASGYNVEVMEMLFNYFNTNYSVKHYEPSWGLPLNGSYTGILGVAHRKEVDIPLNGFILAAFRLKIIRYTVPFAKIDMSILYETPTAIVPPTTYALPFSFSVWISILIVIGCTLTSLAISMYFSPAWKAADLPSVSFHSKFFRLITGTFFDEVLDNVPPSVSAKVIFGTLLVATLSVYVFYTSIFTSVLAYRELKMPIRNLDDLIVNRDYTPMTVKSTVFDSLFRFSQTGLFKALWKKMSKNEKLSVQPLAQAVNSMYVGKNVLVTDGASTIAAMNNNCSISLIKTRLFQEYIFLVTRTDFPYNRMFYIRLLKLTEGGILRRFGKKYMTEVRPPCPVEEPSLTLGLLQVIGLFFLLGCGLILSLITLGFEVAIISSKI